MQRKERPQPGKKASETNEDALKVSLILGGLHVTLYAAQEVQHSLALWATRLVQVLDLLHAAFDLAAAFDFDFAISHITCDLAARAHDQHIFARDRLVQFAFDVNKVGFGAASDHARSTNQHVFGYQVTFHGARNDGLVGGVDGAFEHHTGANKNALVFCAFAHGVLFRKISFSKFRRLLSFFANEYTLGCTLCGVFDAPFDSSHFSQSNTPMKVVVVANPKGGAGKSTLSTNIAGYFASQGHQVMLGDADTQQSSKFWLSQRPETLPRISTWEYQPDLVLTAKPPRGTTHVVIDTPGGISGWRLQEVIERADKVIVPVMPSVFDMQATNEFLLQLVQITEKLPTRVAVVGNRVDTRTISAANLRKFIESLQVPVLSYLRDTQYYLHMAAHGLSMFDITPSKVQKDLEQWVPICHWLDQD